MIDDVMDPVIVPWGEDETEREKMAGLLRGIENAPFLPAGVQRKLQQYVVPVPAKARAAMLGTGAVPAILEEEYGERLVDMLRPPLSDPAPGLRLDDPNWRSREDNLFCGCPSG